MKTVLTALSLIILLCTACKQPVKEAVQKPIQNTNDIQPQVLKTLHSNNWYDKYGQSITFNLAQRAFVMFRGIQHTMTTEGCYSSSYYDLQFEGTVKKAEKGLYIEVEKIYPLNTISELKIGSQIRFKQSDEQTLVVTIDNEERAFKAKLKKKDPLSLKWFQLITKRQ